MISEIDKERVAKETLPSQTKKLISDKQFGVIRFATYIQNYSNYGSHLEFIKLANNDEWQEIERMYLDDWNTRLYSNIFKLTIGDISDEIKATIKEHNIKKLLRQDIKEFYEYYKTKIERYSRDN